MAETDATPEDIAELISAVNAVSNELDADIILFNQPISESIADDLHDSLEPKHKNVFFILVTNGGDAHAAYVIARDLQLHYEKVSVCIAGDCYSAGTLIVLGAHELVIDDRGRLGPLDVQLLKKDELDQSEWGMSERMSGLTVGIALDELGTKAAESVHNIARHLKVRSRGQLSFKTALDIAATMTAHMFGEIYKQVDPIKIGEDARSLQIASHYGKMLIRKSQNTLPQYVFKLLQGYPSHDCIIDRAEATELFNHVRPLSVQESKLIELLGSQATNAFPGSEEFNLVIFDTDGLKEENNDITTTNKNNTTTEGPRREKSEARNSAVPTDNGRTAAEGRAAKAVSTETNA